MDLHNTGAFGAAALCFRPSAVQTVASGPQNDNPIAWPLGKSPEFQANQRPPKARSAGHGTTGSRFDESATCPWLRRARPR